MDNTICDTYCIKYTVEIYTYYISTLIHLTLIRRLEKVALKFEDAWVNKKDPFFLAQD